MAKIDDEFLLANYQRMSQRKMAKHFGVSPSTINRHLERLGLKGASGKKRKRSAKRVAIVTPDFTKPPDAGKSAPDASPNDLQRMKDLRDILLIEIKGTGGKDVAALSKEYRAVLKEIRAMEGVGDVGASGFGDLASSFQGGVPATDMAVG